LLKSLVPKTGIEPVRCLTTAGF